MVILGELLWSTGELNVFVVLFHVKPPSDIWKYARNIPLLNF